jgi:threonine synthase
LKELQILGLIKETPRLIGVQAKGAAPIADAYKKGILKIDPVENPETIATAIRIGRPASWKKALKAVRESKGCILTVSDKEIVEGQKLLARIEGLFVEPASATTIAVIPKLIENRLLDNSDKVVCVATGHGLKDPEIAISTMKPPIKIGIDFSELEEVIKKII